LEKLAKEKLEKLGEKYAMAYEPMSLQGGKSSSDETGKNLCNIKIEFSRTPRIVCRSESMNKF